jgi:hypothetical protein
MHLSGSLEYQFATVSSMEMIRDLVRVASSPPVEAMAALLDMRNFRGSEFPWYLGGVATQWCKLCWRWLANGLLGSTVPSCGGGEMYWLCSADGSWLGEV